MTDTVLDERSTVAQILLDAHPDNGDDAAPFRIPGGEACISTDATIEGVHAPLDTPLEHLGRRAVARALSDLAAMGATPVGVTCALLVPDSRWSDAVVAMRGARALALERGCDVLGGDLARMPTRGGPLTIVVTVVGSRTSGGLGFSLRSGARVGDVVAVTGAVGGAGHALRSGAALLPEPPDRLGAGRILGPFATSMIDLSDGIASDALHLAQSSDRGLRIDLDTVPLAVAGIEARDAARDGDDYELLVTLPRDRVGLATRALADRCAGLALTVIGSVTDDAGRVQFCDAGDVIDVGPGFVHE